MADETAMQERIAALEARVVALQALIGVLLRAVERHCAVEVTMGGEDEAG